MTGEKQSGARPPAAPRPKPRTRSRRGATEVAWRDPLTWVTVVLLLAVGFGGAYALWWRTWQLDQARELDWYVKTGQVRLRDVRTRIEAFFMQPDLESMAMLSLSAKGLEGALAQIPRRGPVEWRAEIVGLSTTIGKRFSGALRARIAAAPEEPFAELTEVILPLRDALYDLDQALGQTVIRSGQDAQRTNWTPEVTEAVLDALRRAREAAENLPE